MNDISHPIAKATAGAVAFFAFDWLTYAGKICAALTAIVIFSEWLWKRVVKPLLRHYGVLKSKAPCEDKE